LAVTAAAVAVNVAVVAPAGTRTEAGTVNADVRLLASETVVPAVGAAERVMVQEVEVEADSVVLAHCSPEMVIGAVIEKTAEAVDAPREAVTVAL
jgi:hypothetical protein